MNFKQLFALVSLRHKLTLHQEKKAGRLNVVLSRIIRVVVIFASVMAFILPIILGAWLLKDISSAKLLAVWNGMVMVFLFAAVMTLIGQLQLNEVIPIDKLLHLPVSLNGAFLLNYLSSFLNMLMVLFAPAMIGFTIGAIIAKGSGLFILLPALLAIFFLTTSLFHQFKAIFARIIQNKRTKAIVIVVIPFLMVTSLVLFSLLADAIRDKMGSNSILGDIMSVWVGWKPSIYSVLAIAALGGASQYSSYRSLVKFYTGASSPGKKSSPQTSSQVWPSNFLFCKLPFVSVEASAVGTAGFRNIIRAPEALMALVPLLILLLIGIPYLIDYGSFTIPDLARPHLQIWIITVVMLGFPAFLFSAFGYDRDGFRAFVLSPLKRADVLVGKNLAIGIPTLTSGIVLLVIAQIFKPDHALAFIASLLQMLSCFVLMCVIGNVLSVWFPVGLKRGNMQPANAPMIHKILLYAGVLISPFVVIQPATTFIFVEMLASGEFGKIGGWLYLLLTSIQLIVTWLIYRWSLTPLSEGLWQREPEILETVSNLPE